MDLKFQQSEQIAERRRWIIVLVQDADPTAGLTGATGTVYISKNGGTPALSTNSLVEVSAANMPGHYYVELTAGELDTLGWISIVKKTASSKAFHDRGFVSYDDPAARHGGFAVEGSRGKSGGISKIQAKALLDDIRAIVQEELAKEEVEEEVQEIQEQKDYTEKLDAILAAVSEEAEGVDLTPVLAAIQVLPKPIDYTKHLTGVATQLTDLAKQKKMDMSGFEGSVQNLVAQLGGTLQTLGASVAEVANLKQAMAEIQTLMAGFQATLAEQSDMDKRFDAMTSAANNKILGNLTKKITELAIQLVELNYQLKKK